jgi:AraC family transcriptional activator of mtrCDE
MDVLSDILSRLRLVGTLYFRTSFTSPWSVGVPKFESVSRFHYALKGRCLVRIEKDKPPIFLDQGDLIIITKGASHTLFCDPKTENQAIMVDQVVEESGFTGKGALIHGTPGSDHETQLVCGHFAFSKDAYHPLIEALPSHIHIEDYDESSGVWLENTLRMIGAEIGQEQLGSDLIALKMSEIIFAQAIRHYLQREGQNTPVLAGFSDPNIARALTAIHSAPGDNWSLARLAAIAGMSRTAFTKSFSHCVAMTPLNYITRWRMEIARQQLTDSNTSIIEIAENAGYRSEAAFSRVFKKFHNCAPAGYRRMSRI